MARRLSATE